MKSENLDIINTITSEVQFGFGRRYMVIRADLMYDAPQSLLDLTTEMTGRDIMDSKDPALNFKELGKRQPMSETTIYRVFAFKDSEEKMTYKNGVAFVEQNNMRLLTYSEAKWFREMFENLMQWKHSLKEDDESVEYCLHSPYPGDHINYFSSNGHQHSAPVSGKQGPDRLITHFFVRGVSKI